ncbi:MAG: hypothetical protein ACI9HK_002962, partial [Pirellulaceae bacterium]
FLLELSAKIGQAKDLQTAGYEIVAHLKHVLQCRVVCIGLRANAKSACKLLAYSGLCDFDKKSREIALLEAALEETVLADRPLTFPAQEACDRRGTLTLGQLVDQGLASAAVSAPLVDAQGEQIGSVLLLFDKVAQAQTPGIAPLTQSIGKQVGTMLAMLRQAQLSTRSRLMRSIKSLLRTKSTWWMSIAAAVVLGAMFVPVPYRIACDCELQPTTRRFIAAPFDGKLKTAKVALGDLVTSGQILATLDDREIELDLAATDAQINQSEKRRGASMARHEASDAQLAKLEIDRLALKRELLSGRRDNLEIRTPVDGMVISGDWEKSEGAPLSVGQPMFEVAPLDQMVVEVAIAEGEVSFASVGTEVYVRMDAFPGRVWTGTIDKVHPTAEIRQSQNVFVAEVRLQNSDLILRPGMKGQAKIVAPHQIGGWILLHRPWHAARKWLGL